MLMFNGLCYTKTMDSEEFLQRPRVGLQIFARQRIEFRAARPPQGPYGELLVSEGGREVGLEWESLGDPLMALLA